MRLGPPPIGATASLLALLTTGGTFAQTAQFTALGDLPGGDFGSNATAVSADGTTVVGWSDVDPFHHAFRWNAAEGMLDLGVIGDSPLSRAYGVSGDGSIVVGEQAGGSFRWSADSGMEFVSEDLNARGPNMAYAISADGSAIIGMSQVLQPQSAEAFLVADGKDTLLGTFDCETPPWTEAHGVSADGRVVVGYGFSVFCDITDHAFKWTPEDGQRLLEFPQEWEAHQAFAVSGNGRVIVGSGLIKLQGFHAFRYDESGPHLIGDLPGGKDRSFAYGVSADGAVIVGASRGDLPDDEAFLWTTSEGIRALRSILDARGVTAHHGWLLNQANAVSGDGSVIVGWGTNPEGHTEGFVVSLCRADMTGDGQLDLFDFLTFANAFNAAEERADCTHDGVWDLFDFLCFVNAFNAGC